MKKFKYTFTVLAVLAAFFIPGFKSYAGGGDWNTAMAPSGSSVAADGSSAITFSVHAYYYTCSLHDSNGYLVTSTDPNYCSANGYGTASETGMNISGSPIQVTGSGNTLSSSTLTTDSSGHGSFTLKSTVAESKTVSVLTQGGGLLASSTVSFTSPASSTTTTSTSSTKPKTTTTTTPSPATTSATPTSPAATANPTLATVKVGSAMTTDTSPTLNQNQPLVLSGKTVPNGIVTLTIHSTPKTVTTTADKDGNWSYTVTGLEPGNHTIQASVKDPATGQSSTPAQLLAFTVKAAPKVNTVAAAQPQTRKSFSLPFIAGIIILLALADDGWYWWKKKQNNSLNKPPVKLA